MSNTFKVNDKVTINTDITKVSVLQCVQDTTAGKAYTLTGVGAAYHNPLEVHFSSPSPEPAAICFKDDVGDPVSISYEHVTLVKE